MPKVRGALQPSLEGDCYREHTTICPEYRLLREVEVCAELHDKDEHELMSEPELESEQASPRDPHLLTTLR